MIAVSMSATPFSPEPWATALVALLLDRHYAGVPDAGRIMMMTMIAHGILFATA